MAELVSTTYSEAFFEFAHEENRLNEMKEAFDVVANALRVYPDFFEILKSPQINNIEKKQIVDDTFGGRVPEEMINFIKVLIDKGRSEFILSIKDGFDDRYNAHNDLVKAFVETVVPMEEAQLVSLRKSLEALTGKAVEIESILNPELLGGIIIKIGDRIIDGSVKFKLEGLLNQLTQIII